uniref:Ribosomal protein S10 n=1 Tax=Triparma laevis TaxID=1534972 RepID=A0A0K2RWL2_9STRA|nr:ribosomal protein S10 [Triparma laevis]BAS19160.1 ribosomal protein S10 [Triparma laevis]
MSKTYSNKVYNPITLKSSNIEKLKAYFNTYKITLESNDPRMLKSAGTKLYSYIENVSENKVSSIALPTDNIKIYSPFKSPHVNKKSREQLTTAVYRNLYTFKSDFTNNKAFFKAIHMLDELYVNVTITVKLQHTK